MQQDKSATTTIDAFINDAYSTGTVMAEDGSSRDFDLTGMRQEQGEQIAEIVAREGATRSFETGFAYGLSTLQIVKSLIENGVSRDDGPAHIVFDPYQGSSWGYAGRRACRDAGVADLVDLHETDSQVALPAMLADGEQFDFAFIDGGHNFEWAFTDLMYSLKLVKPGGLVLIDDTWMASVRTAVDFFVRNLGVVIDPEASHGAHDWRQRRSLFRRKPRGGRASMLGLRVPTHPRQRTWDHFDAFGDLVRG